MTSFPNATKTARDKIKFWQRRTRTNERLWAFDPLLAAQSLFVSISPMALCYSTIVIQKFNNKCKKRRIKQHASDNANMNKRAICLPIKSFNLINAIFKWNKFMATKPNYGLICARRMHSMSIGAMAQPKIKVKLNDKDVLFMHLLQKKTNKNIDRALNDFRVHFVAFKVKEYKSKFVKNTSMFRHRFHVLFLSLFLVPFRISGL